GFAYSETITASGGTGPYTFATAGGRLPPGIALSGSGVLIGTPSALGSFPLTVQATAASGCTGTASVGLTVNDTTPPALTLPGSIAPTATTPAGTASPVPAAPPH